MKDEIRMAHNEGMMKSQNAKRGDDLSAIRHSSFVILTRVVLIVVVAVAVSCSGKRITKANVDQVTEGMSKKQVESILGPPTSLNNKDFVIMKKNDLHLPPGQRHGHDRS